MCRRFFLLFLIALGLSAANSVRADGPDSGVFWTNASPSDNLWNNPGNWTTSEVPPRDPLLDVEIDGSIQGPLITEGTGAWAYRLRGPAYSGPDDPCTEPHEQVLTITGGSVNFYRYWRIGSHWPEVRDACGVGIVNMSGGTVNNYCNYDIYLAAGSTVNLSGGTINSGFYIPHGYSDDSPVEGPATVHMTGGMINAKAEPYAGGGIRIASHEGARKHGVLNLYGGTIIARDLTIDANGLMDITEGTLIMDGDKSSNLNTYIANGWLVAYGGVGTIVYSYDGGTNVTTVTAKLGKSAAWGPSPNDGAEDVAANAKLFWRPGEYAVTHDVYLGTSFYDVNSATSTSHPNVEYYNVDTNTYDPCGLLFNTTFYWRVDEVGVSERWKGDVWHFAVGDGSAYDPRVSAGPTGLPVDVVLSWKPGPFAASHDVYFGTDSDALSLVSDNQEPNNYHPAPLELGKTYYWRVDENSYIMTTEGQLWSFTVQSYLAVEDFESYDPYINLINATWLDGIRVLDYPPYFIYVNGAGITLGTTEASPADPVHSGKRSMLCGYSNDGLGMDVPYYSETERTFSDPCDWTVLAVKTLGLYFYGDPNNDANETEQMYVALGDADSNAVVKYGDYADEDMNDIKKAEWHEWNIALTDFPGITLTAVKRMYIGFGNRDNHPTLGGWGVVYFDDIRLYVRRCILSRRSATVAALDLSNNCIVDFADVNAVAEDWLDHDFTIVPEAPDPCIVHYKFDETSGTFATDSSGNGYTAVTNTERVGAVEALWESGGKYGGCIRFSRGYSDTGYCLEIPDAAFDNITNRATISVWVNWDDPATMPNGNYDLFNVRGGAPILGVRTSWVAGQLVFWDAAESISYAVDEQDWSGGWNHYAFVKDVDEGYLRIYHNGGLKAQGASSSTMDFPSDLARIGTGTSHWVGAYTGLLDDFRIYNYALSQPEIAYLITGGSNLYVPLDSRANFYDQESINSKAVNFRDYACLVAGWLEETIWPTP
ncbi:MAG TPA: LamG domain-containing protein [Sedimentisphaerales bacterium]|nr:LamG domain-containing protein [Sedimentisphaerales bacterium]